MASLRNLLFSREHSTQRGSIFIAVFLMLCYWLLGEVPFRLPIALMITIVYIAVLVICTAVYQIGHARVAAQERGIFGVCTFLLLIPIQLVLMFTYGAYALYVIITLETLYCLATMRAVYRATLRRK